MDDILDKLIAEIDTYPVDKKIEALNCVKRKIHEISPFVNEPVDCVVWVEQKDIVANDYNPNKVAPPEMKLLEISIAEDGYTQPIVTHVRDDLYEVVDGFHRTRVGKESDRVKERVKGWLPITTINASRVGKKDRVAATIRHNRARGVHGIEPMAQIVAELYFSGWSNKRIALELGMEKDEVLRLKQFTGLGTLFENRDFSKAWEL